MAVKAKSANSVVAAMLAAASMGPMWHMGLASLRRREGRARQQRDGQTPVNGEEKERGYKNNKIALDIAWRS